MSQFLSVSEVGWMKFYPQVIFQIQEKDEDKLSLADTNGRLRSELKQFKDELHQKEETLRQLRNQLT